MDTDALIKLTMGSVKEVVASTLEVVLPPAVYEEAVDQGKAGGYGDAFRIEENAQRGILRRRTPGATDRTERLIRELGLTGGEADVLRLSQEEDIDGVVSDDARFLQVLDGLGTPFATPSALLVLLVQRGSLSRGQAQAKLEALRPFVSEAEYVEAFRALAGG